MRRLGQHFLRSAKVIQKIAALLDPRRDETIIEIGAGHGELTEKLGDRLEVLGVRNAQIIAVEKDGQLVAQLKKKFADNKQIEIIHADIRKFLPKLPITYHLSPRTYVVVGNIPYYLTGRLLRILGELEPKPNRIVLTIQKEVAERIIASPPRMNRLAASVQFWATPEIAGVIGATSFDPQPEVDSVILKLETRSMNHERLKLMPTYYRVMRALFRQPRKTILNNLLSADFPKDKILAALGELNIKPSSRPQDLSVQGLMHLSAALSTAAHS